ncbi:biotin--protein ligase [Fundidesulfovibrio terrae]|uniref:biotin--protein ligase n=1 Tax=Fundidesulfovibrio terrae TaxID=2922866 RepID=UPI001FAEDDFB|nr:biotin--protein ligase [Fundidesulfovibrio terrae]
MLYVLWDEAHLWGVLMLRALSAWGLPVRLTRAHELAGGLLDAAPPRVLAVPGGFASRKAACLGQAGLEAVRRYVAGGGSYLGICGGAGLGLTVPGGLALCPWTREPFAHRLQHFASGNVELVPRRTPYTPGGLERPLAPVWWPAKFRPMEGAVEVVAAYGRPGPGFMMADIPLSLVPGQALEDWEALYGVRLAPAFAEGDPCIVAGNFGQGRYVLSHAHLETPDSPEANAWLAHILAELSGAPVPRSSAPACPSWRIGGEEPRWTDPALVRAMALMLGAVTLGEAHGLLSWREPWLLGWRQGLPGAQLSGILAMLDQALALEPSQESLRFFERRREQFSRTMELLATGLSGYLLAERLALTLMRVDPEAVPERGLREARTNLFGPPPGTGGFSGAGGGLCGMVLGVLEECIHLTAKEATPWAC